LKVLDRARFGRYLLRFVRIDKGDPPQVYVQTEYKYKDGFDIVVLLDGVEIHRRHYKTRRNAGLRWREFKRNFRARLTFTPGP